MQGSLRELDITALCHMISAEQQTGELWIESQSDYWLLFLEAGKVVYASRNREQTAQLRDYLYGLNLTDSSGMDKMRWLPQLGSSLLAYEQLWWLLQERTLAVPQAIAMVEHMIREVCFDLLCLKEGSFRLSVGSPLRPQLVSLPLLPLLRQTQTQVQCWYQLFPHIPSLDHYPQPTAPPDADDSGFNLLLPLAPWLNLTPPPSIRQIARYRLEPVIHVVKEVYTAVMAGMVKLLPPSPHSSSHATSCHILCVDDSLTACRTLQYILETSGYQVTISTDPIHALTIALQLKPDLILCDVYMPNLSGYEFCAMLRQTHALAHTPIIMVTSADGYIDRSQARVSGSTDYLTKPVLDKELLSLVAKHLNCP